MEYFFEGTWKAQVYDQLKNLLVTQAESAFRVGKLASMVCRVTQKWNWDNSAFCLLPPSYL